MESVFYDKINGTQFYRDEVVLNNLSVHKSKAELYFYKNIQSGFELNFAPELNPQEYNLASLEKKPKYTLRKLKSLRFVLKTSGDKRVFRCLFL